MRLCSSNRAVKGGWGLHGYLMRLCSLNRAVKGGRGYMVMK